MKKVSVPSLEKPLVESRCFGVGSVVRTTSINRIVSADDTGKVLHSETWRTKKGFRYVLLLLAVEEVAHPVDDFKAMKDLGWKPVGSQSKKNSRRSA